MAKARFVIIDADSIIRFDLREHVVRAGYGITGKARDSQAGIVLALRPRPHLATTAM